MNLQIIKSINGKDEYVLLPVPVYKTLHKQIESKLSELETEGDYVFFDPADYVDNPVALARIKARMTQKELAEHMGVTQAYISKIEQQEKVTPKLLSKVQTALKKCFKK